MRRFTSREPMTRPSARYWLCKLLEVQAYIGRGYFVTERGEGVFAFACKAGRVGCLVLDEAGAYNGDGDVLSGQLLTMMSNEFSFVDAF
jgi:hypothetical protein